MKIRSCVVILTLLSAMAVTSSSEAGRWRRGGWHRGGGWYGGYYGGHYGGGWYGGGVAGGGWYGDGGYGCAEVAPVIYGGDSVCCDQGVPVDQAVIQSGPDYVAPATWSGPEAVCCY